MKASLTVLAGGFVLLAALPALAHHSVAAEFDASKRFTVTGKVTKVDEHEIELEVSQGVKVRVVKSMLSDVRPHGAKAAND